MEPSVSVASAAAAKLAEEARRFTLVNSELRNGVNTILRFITYAIIPTGIALIISQLLVNADDLAEAVRRMVAGLVRIDGGTWTVPAGTTRTADEFGGEVGIVAVP